RIPGALETWLKTAIPFSIDRNSMLRKRDAVIPMELIREGVVNAMVHRDYSIRGAKCHIIVDADKVVIRSPGMPLPQITIDQLNRFEAPMLSRNPELHYAFSSMGYAEERGLGLRS